MKNVPAFIIAAAAAAAFSSLAIAGETALVALQPAAKQGIRAELTSPSTAQLKIIDAGYNDFDALSAVNDPLYRAGTRALLKQNVKSLPAAAGQGRGALRDAPNSRPAPVIKKPRIKKHTPSDPVKVKNTL